MYLDDIRAVHISQIFGSVNREDDCNYRWFCYYFRMIKTLKKHREYTAFFEENEHGGYTIMVPALPGLVTEAKDMKQAKVVLEDAIQCYIDGLKKVKLEIPEESFVASMRLQVAI